jgi:hypothetical protein
MAMTQVASQELIEGFANSKAEVMAQARARWSATESYQANIVQKYRDMHHFYNPANGDQWPEDLVLRPGQIHISTNLCKAAVDVDARLESISPRITLPVQNLNGNELKRAEAAEALHLEWLELSGFESWFHTLCQTKSMYGKGVLKPYWNDKLKRPDVTVIENPANLRLGWGTNDYRTIDWAIYEYAISPQECKLRYPDKVMLTPGKLHDDPPNISVIDGDHDDPLRQKDDEFTRPFFRQRSDYERSQVKVWDYWYVSPDGTVMSATLLNGEIVDGPHAHPHLADIPYIVIEHDHEPGSPEGIGTIEAIQDLQIEFNRLLSHGLQHIADNVDPAYYIAGPGADQAPTGIVPRSGEVVGVGDVNVGAWPKTTNTFPIDSMMQELWNEFHRLTGLPEILFGQTPGADTSGRAIAIQVEAAANRLEPRRRRLYQGLKELLIFWTIMAERKNPKIAVGEDQSVGVKEIVQNFRTWKIIAPEITPRDNIEVTQNEINKVNAKLTSRRSAMNQVGIEAPEYELSTIKNESSDLQLNPAEVQAQLSVRTIVMQLEQMQMQNQQMRQELAALQGQQASPQGVVEQAAATEQTLQTQQQAAAPAGFEDQNQPASFPGGPPPPGAAPPGGEGAGGPASLTALSRQGEALNQIAFNEDFS